MGLLAALPTVVISGLVSGLVLWCSQYYWRRDKKPPCTYPVARCKVLFFPDAATAHTLSRERAGEDCVDRGSLSVLLETLQGTRKSLDVCVFTMSCKEIGDVLISAHSSGVTVRVVTDNEQSASTGSQIERLRRNGIQVRTDKSAYFMHHKFAVVDEEVVINGSLNWTLQGVCGNQENVVIMNAQEVVAPFSRHFERLWNMYDPETM